VASATRATSSKHFLHASDFPMPESASEFPHHREIARYLQSYVDHFGIRERFRLRTSVQRVWKDGQEWVVEARSDADGDFQERFDRVVVCTGPHQRPNIDPQRDPLYRGFDGPMIHAAEFKDARDIGPGESVLVVGAGESSADIVSECVQRGGRVHWSVRSGQWFADRNMGPYPADHITTQGMRVFAGRFFFFEYLVRRFVARVFVNLAWGRGGHGVEPWTPTAPYLHQFLNKSRDGILEVYKGNAVAHRGVTAVVGARVSFEGEAEAVDCDRIILATGYAAEWPFLSLEEPRLYKRAFALDDPTLAFVGFARPIVGSIPSLSELQARWVASVWSGASALPARAHREIEAATDRRHREYLILDSTGGALVDQELYATEIATRLGAHVRWWRLLFGWPRAFLVLVASPWAPFKYRLSDPDREGRRRALEDIERELPSTRAPTYFLAAGVATMLVTTLAVAATFFLVADASVALRGLAGAILAWAFLMRVSEPDGKLATSRAGKLRDMFPF
jgi:dimethylaniline monooxygenase (N-oxide forming)